MDTGSIKQITAALLVALLFGCNKKKLFDGPNRFTDGFEAYDSVSQLMPDNDSLWSLMQITLEGSKIEIDTTVSHSGGKSLKFSGKGTNDGILSKCSIMKHKMAFWEGDVVYYSIWYLLESGGSAEWLFLIDLEEQIQIGAGPGMRIAVDADTALVMEHKYPKPHLKQEDGKALLFPRDQWVHIEVETLLSQKNKGYVKVWQDDQLIIKQKDWQTLPKDILTLMQGTKAMYSSFEIGLTANPGPDDLVLYADDVLIEVR